MTTKATPAQEYEQTSATLTKNYSTQQLQNGVKQPQRRRTTYSSCSTRHKRTAIASDLLCCRKSISTTSGTAHRENALQPTIAMCRSTQTRFFPYRPEKRCWRLWLMNMAHHSVLSIHRSRSKSLTALVFLLDLGQRQTSLLSLVRTSVVLFTEH